MRFCCNDTGINLNKDMFENEAALKRLHEIGFEVIGVHGVDTATEDTVLRFRDLAEHYGITVAMSPCGSQPAHPDTRKRQIEHDRLKSILRKMKMIGGDLIHITGGSYDGTGWWYHPKNFTEEALDDVVAETKKLVPYAEDSGICICPETTQWCIIYSPQRMKEFVDRVASDNVQITFDPVNHMQPGRIHNSGVWMRETIDFLGDRIGQLHVKDVQVEPHLVSQINEAPLGTGLLDHEAVITASRGLEPWKLFSLEHFNDPTVDPMVQRDRGYRYIENAAHQLGHKWSERRLTRQRWLHSKI
ncbi:MAG: hypothetical protein DF168_00004 [Candidatus Moanabacter tarae]|uniref:Xylose isomerase-like TIM barrel domain-containing protein n=1 Tax=Candidatus Moanibacter tarae TaxID=2200854 RepID=A0A2Z4AN98_9BACT|nr:MAG: hypothetical protein DF168_00004 [Candidatus Moanabacter tarae]|tara:strand:+ start:28648 stop:29553 length:906 start_codon:yes stop_codon:yes gene_type:complete